MSACVTHDPYGLHVTQASESSPSMTFQLKV